ncbi:COP9 signalosome [Sporodiniella umbellata]|nr:COP9 signalosome [Sporodiniella umbellata]
MNSSSSSLQHTEQLLTQAKIQLIETGAFTPVVGKTDTNAMIVARDILEIGAYYSVRVKDIASFERYIAQLSTYYNDFLTALPVSQQMYPLIGLNLLRLLSQNKLSEFHTTLETIDLEQLQTNPFIKQAVDLEQFLMEGSYNKVWSARSTVKGEEFALFYDVLMNTTRHEIANCSERAYEYLPINDACTLLFLKNTEELLSFAKEREWQLNPAEQKVYFSTEDDNVVEIPQEQTITRTLGYAKELERIV